MRLANQIDIEQAKKDQSDAKEVLHVGDEATDYTEVMLKISEASTRLEVAAKVGRT